MKLRITVVFLAILLWACEWHRVQVCMLHSANVRWVVQNGIHAVRRAHCTSMCIVKRYSRDHSRPSRAKYFTWSIALRTTRFFVFDSTRTRPRRCRDDIPSQIRTINMIVCIYISSKAIADEIYSYRRFCTSHQLSGGYSTTRTNILFRADPR